jgi:hypothetical protein
VKLSPTYSKHSDAADGPLQPGDVGKLLENDHSIKPYLVEAADGRQWWYEHKALVKALSGDGSPAADAPTLARENSDSEGQSLESDGQDGDSGVSEA